MDVDLILIHGFWSSPATWDRLASALRAETDLSGLRIHHFGYKSPRLRLPLSPARIPDYDDIAQSIPAYIDAELPGGSAIAVVTHSQGGLIFQRFLAWMLHERRGCELARFRLAVMLSCPNEGAEYLRSIRAVAGMGHHPQAQQLKTLDQQVTEARRIVLRQIINADEIGEGQCPIPFHVYSGSADNVVLRQSAQSVFPDAAVLPGDHFTIIDPAAEGNVTVPALKRLLLGITPGPASRNHGEGAAAVSLRAADADTPHDMPTTEHSSGVPKYSIRIKRSTGIQIGDGNTQIAGGDDNTQIAGGDG